MTFRKLPGGFFPFQIKKYASLSAALGGGAGYTDLDAFVPLTLSQATAWYWRVKSWHVEVTVGSFAQSPYGADTYNPGVGFDGTIPGGANSVDASRTNYPSYHTGRTLGGGVYQGAQPLTEAGLRCPNYPQTVHNVPAQAVSDFIGNASSVVGSAVEYVLGTQQPDGSFPWTTAVAETRPVSLASALFVSPSFFQIEDVLNPDGTVKTDHSGDWYPAPGIVILENGTDAGHVLDGLAFLAAGQAAGVGDPGLGTGADDRGVAATGAYYAEVLGVTVSPYKIALVGGMTLLCETSIGDAAFSMPLYCYGTHGNVAVPYLAPVPAENPTLSLSPITATEYWGY